jgi:prepilin-type N-terminal cleavage/methylation domain-containing protein
MRRRRGFTLLELFVVIAMVAVMSALGLSALADAVIDARYRAERARVFLTVTEARDTARDRQQTMAVSCNLATLTVTVGPCAAGVPIESVALTALRCPVAGSMCFIAGATGASGPGFQLVSCGDPRRTDRRQLGGVRL